MEDPKIIKYSTAFGDVTIDFNGEKYWGNPILDTRVIIEGKTICWITWNDKDVFINELNDVISKYRI
ncbi:hypothetical protein M0Q97_10610 [Candidatus Dojkabacteria bacterium]|jgi:hypothetical protein|nr:hypothetical protein [Candidatus Dojkabacteria bacterium]